MTQDDIIRQLIKDGYTDEEIEEALSQEAPASDYEGSMSGFLSDVVKNTAAGITNVLPYGKETARDLLENLMSSGYTDPIEGGRQLFNYLTGDEEELEGLGQDYATSQQRLEERTSGSPVASTVGQVLGIAPAIASGSGVASLAPKVASGGGKLVSALRGLLGGSVAGTVGGASTPLTSEEEQNSQRAINAGVGGALGGTLGAVMNPAADLMQDARRRLPEEYMSDFTTALRGGNTSPEANLEAQQLVEGMVNKPVQAEPFLKRWEQATAQAGRVPGAQTENIKSLRSKVGSKVQQLRKQFDEDYLKIEGKKMGLIKPKVIREAIGDATGQLKDITREISAPKAQKLLDKLMEADAPITFKEVRDVQREIKSLAGGLGQGNKLQPRQMYEVSNMLDKALDSWASGGANRKSALGEARKLDEQYRDQMGPWTRTNSPEGKFYGYGQFPDGKEKGVLQSGPAVESMIQRVPEAQGDIKNLLMDELGRANTSTAAMNILKRSGTERILSPEEVASLTKALESPDKPVNLDKNWVDAMMGNMGGSKVAEAVERAPESLEPIRTAVSSRIDQLPNVDKQAAALQGSGVQALSRTPELRDLRVDALRASEYDGNIGPLAGILDRVGGANSDTMQRIIRGVPEKQGPTRNNLFAELLRSYLAGQAAGNIDILPEQ